MTVGYHAPPEGSRSGVADYAGRLLRALRALGNVEPDAAGADVHLYHLGNNRLHEAIYASALERPGVIVLHDAVLHHFLLGTLTHDEYLNEWVYNYGEWRRDLGEELWRERARSGVEPRYFEFPMLRRVCERSLAVIVHNPGAAAMARAHGAVNVVVIPHFYEASPAPEGVDLARFRERIGVGQGTKLFGIFGYLREPKRILQCLAAFRKLRAALPDCALLLAGEAVSGDLDRLLRFEGVGDGVYRLPHLTEGELHIAAASVDCCLNLRFPAAGETSGIAVHLMSLAKPVIISRNAENSAIPETGALRVTHGIAESAELFDHMVLVTGFPELARRIGREGQMHLEKHHALEQVARQYWETLCAVR